MPDKNTHLHFIIEDPNEPVRLDRFLGSKTEIGSRTKALYLIEQDRVHVNRKRVKASYLLRQGDVVDIVLPTPTPSVLEKYDFALDIVFEDADVIVINKPAGLVVHPAHGHQHDTLVNALLHYTKNLSMRFGEERPGIVHRIDKETSGLLVVAKNDHAHEILSQQFKEKTIKRLYEAVIYGCPQQSVGCIESRLARHPQHRKKFASVALSQGRRTSAVENQEAGKLAITSYRVLQSIHGFSLLELKLTTGRTHQIRVHCSEMGHPIVGDELYGADKKLKKIMQADLKAEIQHLGRFLLHAKVLGFHHPQTREWFEFQREWPQSELQWMQKWKLKETI